MAITRRQFLKYAAASAAALGLSELELFQLTEKIMAWDSASKLRVIGLQGQACNGDLTALANLMNSIPPNALNNYTAGPYTHKLAGLAADPTGATIEEHLSSVQGSTTIPTVGTGSPTATSTLDDVLIDLIELTFHPTAAAPAGALGFVGGVINAATGGAAPGNIIMIEGSIPIGDDELNGSAIGKDACKIGAKSGNGTIPAGEPMSMATTLKEILDDANNNTAAIIALGTCASYGGIPAAKNGNLAGKVKGTYKYASTRARSVSDAIAELNPVHKPPVVNIPGCPARPEDLFLVVAQALIDVSQLTTGAILKTPLDKNSGGVIAGRPTKILGINLFDETQHYNCSRRGAYALGNFARTFADTDGDGTGNATTGKRCLTLLGCKGPQVFASCQRSQKHQWNPVKGASGKSGTSTGAIHNVDSNGNWTSDAVLGVVTNESGGSCIKNGHPCIGCKEKGFPDRFAPLVDYQ